MRHRGDGEQDLPLGEQSPGGGSDSGRHGEEFTEPAGPELGQADLAERLDVDPDRGDVKG